MNLSHRLATELRIVLALPRHLRQRHWMVQAARRQLVTVAWLAKLRAIRQIVRMERKER